jgi:hypothetical protein
MGRPDLDLQNHIVERFGRKDENYRKNIQKKKVKNSFPTNQLTHLILVHTNTKIKKIVNAFYKYLFAKK